MLFDEDQVAVGNNISSKNDMVPPLSLKYRDKYVACMKNEANLGILQQIKGYASSGLSLSEQTPLDRTLAKISNIAYLPKF
ncbi:hypothetical protein CWI36_0950p0010 [Hamiltosporidium magnivora]|uniref:Uncharacterized protein n=1 Tax=Hamiltosporidium magnivora TaxID=148818 RepID=A0A4Q9L7T5_9MICR|nr:hypothetical protein CWI36_0950p0010 [Hamiltosporidium magnivora]